MSHDTRPVPTRLLICDICDQPIEKGNHIDGGGDAQGSVTRGYIAHPVTSRTRHAWLIWPPPSWFYRGGKGFGRRHESEFCEKRFDFHGECIVALVEMAVAARQPQPSPKRVDGVLAS